MLISIVVMLLIVGVLLWAADRLPIDGTIKTIIRVIVVVAVVLWLVQLLLAVPVLPPWPSVR